MPHQHKVSLDDEAQALLEHLKRGSESVSVAFARILRENAAAKGFEVVTTVKVVHKEVRNDASQKPETAGLGIRSDGPEVG